MKSTIKFYLLCAISFLMFGCAHPISLSPNLTDGKLDAVPASKSSVAYYISEADRGKEITSAGGGGDKVRYFPYRDLEAGIYKVLSSVYANVTKLPAPQDAATIEKNGVTLVFNPLITTTSSSPSLLTWPPTKFGIDLSCNITDATGKGLKQFTVRGDGAAEFEEFKGDFSLSAKRASNDVLQKLLKALKEMAESAK
jgi:hypothetical protein